MPPKKGELTVNAETEEELVDYIKKPGITLVEVYQAWAGSTIAKIHTVKKMEIKYGENFRSIDCEASKFKRFEAMRSTCTPTFLIYQNMGCVYTMKGLNGPKLLDAVDTAMDRWKATPVVAEFVDVAKLEKVRCVAAKKAFAEVDDDVDGGTREIKEFAEYNAWGPFTIALLKPDAVKKKIVEDVKDDLMMKGIRIAKEMEHKFTEKDARLYYYHMRTHPLYAEIIANMITGPSILFVLVGPKGNIDQDSEFYNNDVIRVWKEMMGPWDMEVALEKEPDSVRARYGDEGVFNVVEGSRNQRIAYFELFYFFADDLNMKKDIPRITHQQTLAMVRPEAVREENLLHNLLEEISNRGYMVTMMKTVALEIDFTRELYSELSEAPDYDDFCRYMMEGPACCLALSKPNAVEIWKYDIGPKLREEYVTEKTCLRAKFDLDWAQFNSLHGSSDLRTAKKELSLAFPVERTIAAVKPSGCRHHLKNILKYIKFFGFDIVAQEDIFLMDKQLANNFYWNIPMEAEWRSEAVRDLTLGQTVIMVVERMNAMAFWRELCGPTSPEDGGIQHLRAIFGSDTRENALYAAKCDDDVQQMLKNFFPSMYRPPRTTEDMPDYNALQVPTPGPNEDLSKQAQISYGTLKQAGVQFVGIEPRFFDVNVDQIHKSFKTTEIRDYLVEEEEEEEEVVPEGGEEGEEGEAPGGGSTESKVEQVEGGAGGGEKEEEWEWLEDDYEGEDAEEVEVEETEENEEGEVTTTTRTKKRRRIPKAVEVNGGEEAAEGGESGETTEDGDGGGEEGLEVVAEGKEGAESEETASEDATDGGGGSEETTESTEEEGGGEEAA